MDQSAIENLRNLGRQFAAEHLSDRNIEAVRSLAHGYADSIVEGLMPYAGPKERDEAAAHVKDGISDHLQERSQ